MYEYECKHVNDSSLSQQQQLVDETLVKNLVERFVNIWNHHDAKAFAYLLTEDCKMDRCDGTKHYRKKRS